MKKLQLPIFLFAFIILGCFSCNQKDSGDYEINYYSVADYQVAIQYIDIPQFPLDYTNQYPSYYLGRNFERFDKDMATLGRVLFYDKKLSTDETVSCASCHKQNFGFADDVNFSLGIEGRKTNRNSLALGAVFNFQEIYSSTNSQIPFFWDHSASSSREVSTQSFTNENKMGMEMQQVVDAVKSLEYYPMLFEMAYGDRNINEDRILNSISTFVNSIGSFNSKYDKAIDESGFLLLKNFSNSPSGDLAMLSIEENRGKELYFNNCASCHGSVNIRPEKIQANNGLDIVYEDNGVGDFTNNSIDMGKFKVPTLRNIMVTAPYMHDGRFATIEKVLDHYSSGIQMHPNLDGELKSGNAPLQMNFTTEQRADLIAFLNTFTDTEFLTAEKYSDPFK